MAPYWTLLLLFMVVMAKAGKYFYVRILYDRFEAQTHCRTNHTDLAPIDSYFDISLIWKLNPNIGPFSWIGLERTDRSSTGWMWSGGGELTKAFWALNEPNNVNGVEDYAAINNNNLINIYNYSWVDAPGNLQLTSICYKVHAIRVRMTWYDALDYCRRNHQDLASVASETEMMLIKKELRKELSSHNVWIGLQYFVDGWRWMDGQPFSYESWGPNPKPTCPNIDWSCGAIRVKGLEQNTLVKVEAVAGWNSLNCNLRKHFLCY